MATVCIGPEFQPDTEGRLRLRACGDPAEQEWPFPCPPNVANPLRVDPACGLWIPPAAEIGVVQVNGSATSGGPIGDAFTQIDSADITLTNPSPCYPARVVRLVNVDIHYNIPPGDARAGCRVAGNSIQLIENPAPSTGSEMTEVHWEATRPVLSTTLIPPGGQQTYTAPIEVGNGQGAARWTQVFWDVTALIIAGLA